MVEEFELLRDREWLEQQLALHTYQEIADGLGCSVHTIRYWKCKHDIPDRPKIYNRGAVPLRDGEWLEKQLEKKMAVQVADELGCASSNVYYWMRQHGLETRGLNAITDEILDETFQFIVEHWREHQASPTVREIRDEVGFSSTSVTATALETLEEQGRIRREPHKARQIFVVGGEWVYHGEV